MAGGGGREFEDIHYEADDGIATITIDRQE